MNHTVRFPKKLYDFNEQSLVYFLEGQIKQMLVWSSGFTGKGFIYPSINNLIKLFSITNNTRTTMTNIK